MKQVKMFRLDSDSIEALTNLVNMTSLNQTQIVENALKLYYATFLTKNSTQYNKLVPDIQSKKEAEPKKSTIEEIKHEEI